MVTGVTSATNWLKWSQSEEGGARDGRAESVILGAILSAFPVTNDESSDHEASRDGASVNWS